MPEPKSEPVAAPEPAPELAAEPEPAPEPEVVEEQEEDSGYGNVILFILFNILVIGIGGGAYWYLRKRSGSIFNELSAEDDVAEEIEELEAQAVEVETETGQDSPAAADDTEEEEEDKIEPDKDMDDLSDLDPKEDETK